MSTTLLLARHGQTIWHAENRYAGVSDIGLTDEGRAQAEALGRWAAVHRPDAIWTSPSRGRSPPPTPPAVPSASPRTANPP